MTARRTHIDHLLERKAISKRKHAELKAAEVSRKAATAATATEIAVKAVVKAAGAEPPNV